MADGTISVEQSGTADITILQSLTVGTTPVQIPYFNCEEILIKSDPGNTAYINVQLGPNQTSTNYFPISPDGSLRIGTNQSDKYWLVSTSSGQIVYIASAKAHLASSSGTAL